MRACVSCYDEECCLAHEHEQRDRLHRAQHGDIAMKSADPSLQQRRDQLNIPRQERTFPSKPDGWEHYEEYRDGHHEQMAENWPEPRYQLHGGGLAMTKVMETELAIGRERGRILDVCCGEGATAIRLAREYGHCVNG